MHREHIIRHSKILSLLWILREEECWWKTNSSSTLDHQLLLLLSTVVTITIIHDMTIMEYLCVAYYIYLSSRKCFKSNQPPNLLKALFFVYYLYAVDIMSSVSLLCNCCYFILQGYSCNYTVTLSFAK